jgi:hypothetical protein
MLIGTHSVIYSKNPEQDRRILREVFGLRQLAVGGSYVICKLPEAEVSVHESKAPSAPAQELYFLADDIRAFVASMERHHVPCDAVQDTGWGLLTTVHLPGGARLGVYQPKYSRS